jgi:hypothetical protein
MGPAGVGEVMDVPVNLHARKLCVPVLRSTGQWLSLTPPQGTTRSRQCANIRRVSMLQELGANDPIRSRCGPSPTRMRINRIMGRLLAAERSYLEALVSFDP